MTVFCLCFYDGPYVPISRPPASFSRLKFLSCCTSSKTKHWLKNGSKRSTQVTGQQNLPVFVRPEVCTKAQGNLHAAFAAVENLNIRGFQHVPTVKTHVNNCQYVTLPVCHFNTFHSKTSHFSDGLQVAVLPLQLVDDSRASLTWSKCPRKSNQISLTWSKCSQWKFSC